MVPAGAYPQTTTAGTRANPVPSRTLCRMIIREAVRTDLPASIALLADDMLGKAREFPAVDEAYEKAFADLEADPRNFLIVGQDGGEVVACMQITYIPGLGRHGALRSQVEARLGVAASHEGMKLAL